MKASNYHKLWVSIVDAHLKEDWTKAVADKLKRIKFDQAGEMKPGKLRLYVEKHFNRTLVHEYRIKKQAMEIPKQNNKTRLEHHPSKHKQMTMFKGNQLDLF